MKTEPIIQYIYKTGKNFTGKNFTGKNFIIDEAFEYHDEKTYWTWKRRSSQQSKSLFGVRWVKCYFFTPIFINRLYEIRKVIGGFSLLFEKDDVISNIHYSSFFANIL